MKYITTINWLEQERRALDAWNSTNWFVYWLCQGVTDIEEVL
jgi:hypothetical protein